MLFSFQNVMLRNVIDLLELRRSSNEVGTGGVHTHNGSLEPRLFYFIMTHPNLMDINSRANRTKTIIDLGAGDGNFLFVSCSQSSHRRNVIGVELDANRVKLLTERVQLLVNSGLSLDIPSVVEGDFSSLPNSDQRLVEYERAIADGEFIAWFNNAREVMTRDQNVQHGLELRLSTSRAGSVVVSLDRCFRNDPFWHEQVFLITVLRNDVSWHFLETDDESTIPLRLYKYTKRLVPQEGVGHTRRAEPGIVTLEFPYWDRSLLK